MYEQHLSKFDLMRLIEKDKETRQRIAEIGGGGGDLPEGELGDVLQKGTTGWTSKSARDMASNVNYGIALEDLNNVKNTTPTDGDILIYDETNEEYTKATFDGETIIVDNNIIKGVFGNISVQDVTSEFVDSTGQAEPNVHYYLLGGKLLLLFATVTGDKSSAYFRSLHNTSKLVMDMKSNNLLVWGTSTMNVYWDNRAIMGTASSSHAYSGCVILGLAHFTD